MEPSVAFSLPTPKEDTPIQTAVETSTVLSVSINREIGTLVRQILGNEFSFLETHDLDEAKLLTRLEPIGMAVIGMEPQWFTLGKALDLILNLVDQRKNIPIFLYVDSFNRKTLQAYLDLGIINHLSTATYPFELLEQIATFLGKKDRIKKFRQALKEGTHGCSRDLPKRKQNKLPSFPLRTEKNIHSGPLTINPEPFTPPSETTVKGTGFHPFSLNKFSLELAHKIKNPLVSIKTFTELLKRNFDDPHFREDFYPVVNSEIGKINQTVETLTEFGEQFRFQGKRVNYFSLLEEQVNAFNQNRKKQVALRRPAEALPEFFIEESQGQLIHHLLFRAFSDIQGGTDHLKIEVRNIPPNGIEAVWKLPFSHSVDPNVQGLELTLVEWLFDTLNGKFNRHWGPEEFHIRYSLFPTEPTPFVPPTTALPPSWNDRRQQNFPIAFLDRRKTDRRKHTVPIRFGERRNIFQKGYES